MVRNVIPTRVEGSNDDSFRRRRNSKHRRRSSIRCTPQATQHTLNYLRLLQWRLRCPTWLIRVKIKEVLFAKCVVRNQRLEECEATKIMTTSCVKQNENERRSLVCIRQEVQAKVSGGLLLLEAELLPKIYEKKKKICRHCHLSGMSLVYTAGNSWVLTIKF